MVLALTTTTLTMILLFQTGKQGEPTVQTLQTELEEVRSFVQTLMEEKVMALQTSGV